MKKIETILIPTDLSRLSLCAIDCALPFASQSHATIYLIHVIDQAAGLQDTAAWSREQSPMMCSCTLQHELEVYFFDQFQRYDNIVCIIRRGEAAAEILRFAQETSIDLIVMATHGRTCCTDNVVGAVAEQVLRQSTIPIILAHSKKVQDFVEDRKVE